MDFLIEIVSEIIGIILDGALETATSESKRVPAALRILCVLLIVVLFGGVSFLLIFVGVALMRDGNWVPAVILFATAAFFLGFFVWKFVKFFRKRRM